MLPSSETGEEKRPEVLPNSETGVGRRESTLRRVVYTLGRGRALCAEGCTPPYIPQGVYRGTPPYIPQGVYRVYLSIPQGVQGCTSLYLRVYNGVYASP